MSLTINWRGVAEIAYEAYAQTTDNKNFRGEDMPSWEALPPKIQEAWIAAVQAAWDALSSTVMA